MQSLLNEAEEVLRGVGVLLQEGEVAVATGDQLLSIARETYEVCQSLQARILSGVMDPPSLPVECFSYPT